MTTTDPAVFYYAIFQSAAFFFVHFSNHELSSLLHVGLILFPGSTFLAQPCAPSLFSSDPHRPDIVNLLELFLVFTIITAFYALALNVPLQSIYPVLVNKPVNPYDDLSLLPMFS